MRKSIETIHAEIVHELIEQITKQPEKISSDPALVKEFDTILKGMAYITERLKIDKDFRSIYEKFLKLYASEHFDDTEYHRMLQGKGTNEFIHASKKDFSTDSLTGQATATTSNEVVIKIDDYANRKFNTTTKQVLDMLTLKLTEKIPYGEQATADKIQKSRTVKLTVDEFMKMRGLKDKKEARAQLEQAVKDIYNSSIEFDEEHMIIPEGKKKARKEVLHHRLRISDHTITDFEREKPIKNGAVIFRFSFDLAEYLSQAYIMEFPKALFSFSNKYKPHSYYLGRKILLHYNMNLAKENANRISVRILLEACPDMPKYDEIMQNPDDGHIMQKIIEPFEENMNALKEAGILKHWEYCNSGDIPLTKKQLYKYNYSEFITWLIHFELADNYPDQTERLKKIENRKKIAAKKAEK